MKNFIYFISAFTLVLVAASCRPDTDIFIPKDTTTTIESDTSWEADLTLKNNLSTNILPLLNIEKLVNELKAESKFDTCNAERGGTITVPDNVTVTIPASACVTAQNRACTGKMDVEILVLRKKGDFIAYNVPTVSANKQLISGGVVLVKVRQNGQEVKLAVGKTIKVRYVMTEPDAQMQLFEGKSTGRFNFDWVALPSTGQGGVRSTVETWADSSQQRRGYDMILDRFGLINCDRFSNDTSSFNNKFSVVLPDTFTNVNTSVYIAFKDMNSVLSLAGDSKAKGFVPIGRGLPIGRVVTVVAIGLIKEKFYFAKQEITVQNPAGSLGQVVRLTPVITQRETLKETLKDL